MLVREVMTREPATVSPQATIKTALGLLAEQRLTALPVVGDGDEVIGVVSEADLIRELVSREPRIGGTGRADAPSRPSTVEQVMSTHPVTVLPDADLVQAVDLLTSTTVKSLPVVDRRGGSPGC